MLWTKVTHLSAWFILLIIAPNAYGDNLIRNAAFDQNPDGWINQAKHVEGVLSDWSADGGRGGSGALHIRSATSDENVPLIWRYKIENPPAGQRVRFGGWVRGRACTAGPIICAQAWNDQQEMVGFGTTQGSYSLTGDFDWTRIEATIAPPSETTSVHILAFLMGTGEIWYDDLSAEAADPLSKEELKAARRGRAKVGSGLFVARGEYEIKPASSGWRGLVRQLSSSQPASGPTLLLPMPLSYREQVPLTYELSVQPAEKLKAARVYEDRPGNWVAEVELQAVEGKESVELHWAALVLVGPRSFDDVPASVPVPEHWPKDAQPWLKSTRVVQADDPRIQTVAKEIRGDSQDVLEIIRGTLERMRKIFAAQKGRCTELDAVQALEKKGSCTSCANLAAALLRANGIPTRILACYPTWSSPLQTHYVAEAWVPHYGWYPIESTMLEAPLPPERQIHVAIIPPEYEDRSQMRRGAAGGVPYLSLTEYAEGDKSFTARGIADRTRNCDHIAEMRQRFPDDAPPDDWAELFSQARRRWTAWLASQPQPTEPGRLATALDAGAFAGAQAPADVLKRLGK